MSTGPQISLLPDGQRLHLNHGPVDLIIGANAEARADVFHLASIRFQTILEELVSELPYLRRPRSNHAPQGHVARSMWKASAPFADRFITPMAAVAGAVADHMLAAVSDVAGATKIYVNNGGDIAFHLSPGQSVVAAMAGGRVTLRASDPYRGIATSGWRGRSHSLGIADSVSVVAKNAAHADAAATMIANAIDLPGHPSIKRRPARDLAPDSDLGARPVTCAVGVLDQDETLAALRAGHALASDLVARGVIAAVCLELNEQRLVASVKQTNLFQPEPEYA